MSLSFSVYPSLIFSEKAINVRGSKRKKHLAHKITATLSLTKRSSRRASFAKLEGRLQKDFSFRVENRRSIEQICKGLKAVEHLREEKD